MIKQYRPRSLIRTYTVCHLFYIWAGTWQNQQSERAPSEDSDQPGHPPSLISLRCPHEETLGPQLPTEHTAKTLIRLGRCPGWSESWLGAHSFCCFWHVVAHFLNIFWMHCCMLKSSCSNFCTITSMTSGISIYTILWYITFLWPISYINNLNIKDLVSIHSLAQK